MEHFSMRRFGGVLGIVVALASSTPASAGLGIEAPAAYTPGDLITLTLTGDSEGGTQGIIRALLTRDPSLVLTSSAVGTLHSSSEPTFQWAPTAEMGRCGANGLPPQVCTAVDAYSSILGEIAIDLLPSTLSTFQFDTTNATGDLLFGLDADGQGFFGLPGTTAVVAMIPEPATALLVALGLLSLAVAGRGAR